MNVELRKVNKILADYRWHKSDQRQAHIAYFKYIVQWVLEVHELQTRSLAEVGNS